MTPALRERAPGRRQTRPARPARARFAVALGIGLLVLLVLFVLHVGTGSVDIGPVDVLRAILGHPRIPYQQAIVDQVRLPRSLIAPVAGGMLGLAGALIQDLTRNPLTEPSLTGVTSGGILGIVLTLVLLPGAEARPALLPASALAGALAAIVIMYAVTDRLRDGPFVFVLKGIIVSAVLSSVSSLLLVQNNETLPTVMLWITGSLNAKVWSDWATLWPWALLAIPTGLLGARAANLLQLGDEVTIGLGFRVRRARAVLFVIAAVLTAGAVSVVGAIGFIGLIGPHIARRLVGHDARHVFPMSAVVSACLLLFADVLTQAAAAVLPSVASAVPIGAVTALFGAPFFLYLISRTRR